MKNGPILAVLCGFQIFSSGDRPDRPIARLLWVVLWGLVLLFCRTLTAAPWTGVLGFCGRPALDRGYNFTNCLTRFLRVFQPHFGVRALGVAFWCLDFAGGFGGLSGSACLLEVKVGHFLHFKFNVFFQQIVFALGEPEATPVFFW